MPSSDFGPLLSDIGSARSGLTARANSLADIITKSPRWSVDNADQQDSWNGRNLASDRFRLQQLGLLEGAINDPHWTESIDRVADTKRKAGESSATERNRQEGGNLNALVADRGTAGGSYAEVQKQKNAQALEAAKVQVGQQVNELRAAGISDLATAGRQLLSQIIDGNDDSEAMGAALQGEQGNIEGQRMLGENDAQSRALLSNAIGGFLNNTAAPAVEYGFSAADRYNNQLNTNYQNDQNQWRDNGMQGPTPTYDSSREHSWWDW